MKWLALILMISTASCAGSTGGNECTWVRNFTPEPGFEQRWTDTEKRQAVAHNRKVKEFCRE